MDGAVLDSGYGPAQKGCNPIAIATDKNDTRMALKMPLHINRFHATKLSVGFHYSVDLIFCFHCGTELASTRERVMTVCYDCRRTALLTGYWPEELLASNQPPEQAKPFAPNSALNLMPIRDSDY